MFIFTDDDGDDTNDGNGEFDVGGNGRFVVGSRKKKKRKEDRNMDWKLMS